MSLGTETLRAISPKKSLSFEGIPSGAGANSSDKEDIVSDA